MSRRCWFWHEWVPRLNNGFVAGTSADIRERYGVYFCRRCPAIGQRQESGAIKRVGWSRVISKGIKCNDEVLRTIKKSLGVQ